MNPPLVLLFIVSCSVIGALARDTPAMVKHNAQAVVSHETRVNSLANSLVCGGADDTLALNAALAAGDTVVIANTICAVSGSLSFTPSSATLQIKKGGLLKLLSTNVPMTGDLEAGPYQIFTGSGTSSFAGNPVLRRVFAEWWGASPAANASTNATAFNAASAAMATLGSGVMELGPGNYSFNDTWVLGVDGSFTGISVHGTNGYVGTTLTRTGSTSGTAIKINNGRYNHLSDFALINGGAMGSSNGILATGPNPGLQTAHAVAERILIRGFYAGWQAGEAATNSAADEELFVKVSFEQNNYGFYANSNYNDIKYHFTACTFAGNAYGLYTITGYSISCSGCNGGHNTAADFYVSGGGNQINITGWDGEVSNKFLITANYALAELHSVTLRSYTLARADNQALIEPGGALIATSIYQAPNYDGSAGSHLIYNSDSTRPIEIKNYEITDAFPIWINPSYSGSNGTVYNVGQGYQFDNNTGAFLATIPAASGSIVWPRLTPDAGSSRGTIGKGGLLGRGNAITVAELPPSPIEGTLVAVTDSTTNTWGAVIAGGGSNHVLAYYNGTNWTVAGR